MVKPIVTYPDPILREKMPDVDWSDDLSDDLEEVYDTLMADQSGIAIAANQVGVRKRYFVIRPSYAERNNVPYLIINPYIIRSGSITSTEVEGCLSFPGKNISVTRPRKVDVKFTDPESPLLKKNVTLTGQISRVFQHEIDHLDGVLFIDKEKK